MRLCAGRRPGRAGAGSPPPVSPSAGDQGLRRADEEAGERPCPRPGDDGGVARPGWLIGDDGRVCGAAATRLPRLVAEALAASFPATKALGPLAAAARLVRALLPSLAANRPRVAVPPSSSMRPALAPYRARLARGGIASSLPDPACDDADSASPGMTGRRSATGRPSAVT